MLVCRRREGSARMHSAKALFSLPLHLTALSDGHRRPFLDKTIAVYLPIFLFCPSELNSESTRLVESMEATVNTVSNAAKRAVNAFATDNFTTSGASGLVCPCFPPESHSSTEALASVSPRSPDISAGSSAKTSVRPQGHKGCTRSGSVRALPSLLRGLKADYAITAELGQACSPKGW